MATFRYQSEILFSNWNATLTFNFFSRQPGKCTKINRGKSNSATAAKIFNLKNSK